MSIGQETSPSRFLPGTETIKPVKKPPLGLYTIIGVLVIALVVTVILLVSRDDSSKSPVVLSAPASQPACPTRSAQGNPVAVAQELMDTVAAAAKLHRSAETKAESFNCLLRACICEDIQEDWDGALSFPEGVTVVSADYVNGPLSGWNVALAYTKDGQLYWALNGVSNHELSNPQTVFDSLINFNNGANSGQGYPPPPSTP